ncbi:hypothetical protein SAMN04487884_13526 [Butyrivibrio fibrisolvens]|uniref:SGNH/GDSL hydrolase family protein n=1 Tax=Butyrivibrio fibrisolvens TaxID=831 RepID=A0A1H9WVJ7_BUTFI|nr:hypothetical protein [Butyrivibrio fibrisolvens]SES37948.1 hypothetical protein SAMN04487884_13526 [Butyrivibrio fibrisolvens]
MTKFIKYTFLIIVISILMFESVVLGILLFPKGKFYSSYPSLIVDKYRTLIETNEPKIIVVSGSSSAFGLDQNMLEQSSNYKVVNMGLHAGFGHYVISELTKTNINEGDIVLLAYEYNWIDEFFVMEPSLVMTGVDDHIEIYAHVPVDKWPSIIGYLFEFAEMKNSAQYVGGNYSRAAFDSETGQMTLNRVETYDGDNCEQISDITQDIPQETIDYLVDYKNYIEKRGAKVYFVAPPVFEGAVPYSGEEFDGYISNIEKYTGIKYISNPSDYFMSENLMYDTIYHCNNKGEEVRTRLLIDDLKREEIIR